MTTFSFINVETSNYGGLSYNHPNQTIYTVPSGKLAKIKFDSFHMSMDTTNDIFTSAYWLMWSEGTNVLRKHWFGYGETLNENHVRSMSFYNPADFNGVESITGSTSVYENRTMNAMPEEWISNGSIYNFNDGTRGEVNYRNNGGGNMAYGPDTFFMEAGEVLRFKVKSRTNVSATRYSNIRCAVWLEDV